MKRALLGLCGAALATVVSGPESASAGAWTKREGEGVVIFSSGRQAAPVTALAGGLAESDKTFAQVYAEYGVLDGLTFGGSVYGELSTVDLVSGSASAALFARKRVYQDDDGYVASVQVGGSVPFESLLSDTFGASKPDSTAEVSVSLLTGTSWWGDWGSAFTSSGYAYVWRSEGQSDEIRSEFTAGIEPWRCCVAFVSAFGSQPLDGSLTDGTYKVSPSIAYRVWPEMARNGIKPDSRIRPLTIQMGLSYDLLDSDEGLGITFSIWKEF